MPAPLAIRLRNLNSATWETVGTTEGRGVWAENVVTTADEAGPVSCSFTLRRDPRVPWGDLLAATQVQVEVGNVIVWGGRIGQTPGQDPDTISVQGQGLQFHLDDDQYDGYWIHAALADWKDFRDFGVPLANGPSSGSVTGDGGKITYGWKKNEGVSNANGVGVTLDLGPNRTAKRFILSWERSGGQVDTLHWMRGHDTNNCFNAGTFEDIVGAAGIAMNGLPAASTYYGGTFTTPRRFVSHFIFYTGVGGNFGADVTMRILETRIYVDAAFDGGNSATPSVLKASDVIRNVLSGTNLGGTTKVPVLSQDSSRITTSSFSVPEFFPDGARTPRELVQAVNAWHDWLVGVDAEGKLYFRPRPTAPIYEVGEWSGSLVSDASLNNLEDLYNKVVVQGQNGDGTIVSRTRTATSSVLTRQGITRTKRLDVGARLTDAAADTLGDIWLARKAVGGLRGSAAFGPGTIRSVAGGASYHPAHLLLGCGERLRLTDRVDTITGDSGREGIIRSASYNHDDETVSLQLDNDSASFEALLSRLSAVQGSG